MSNIGDGGGGGGTTVVTGSVLMHGEGTRIMMDICTFMRVMNVVNATVQFLELEWKYINQFFVEC